MKTVLITGGTRGIGRASSLRFAVEGFAVIANYTKNETAAKTLEEEIKKTGGTVMTVRADVADAADRERLVSEALSLTGKIDVLVNNAGIADSGLFTDLAGERAARLYAVDLIAPVELTRLVLPRMIHEKSGAIINRRVLRGRLLDGEGRNHRLHKGAGERGRAVRDPRELRRSGAYRHRDELEPFA